MAKLMRRLFRNTKRRIKQGLRDGRTFKLCEAARRLLAEQDHELVSVARLAQEAGISVGAFYQRFRDKDAFLRLVIAERLYSTRNQMERDLDPARWPRSPVGFVTRSIVEQMMRDLQGAGAGIVRTALKCGHLDRTHLTPLVDYREALADRAVALLAHRSGVRHPERAVRASVQIATATVLDALLHDTGTLRPGSDRMAAALGAMMRDGIGVVNKRAEAEDDSTETGDRSDGDEDGMLEMPIEDVVVVEASVSPVPGRRNRRRASTTQPEASIPLINPASMTVPRVAETAAPSRPKRHRPLF